MYIHTRATVGSHGSKYGMNGVGGEGIQVWGSGEQEDESVTDLQAQRCNLLCERPSQLLWLRSRGLRGPSPLR